MNQIHLLEKTWKIGAAVLVTAVLTFGGLFVALSSTNASESPSLSVRTLVSEIDSSSSWNSSVSTSDGKTVAFYVEIHNTKVGTRADGVTAKVNLPSGSLTSHSIPVTISADNASSVTQNVNINVPQGGKVKYVPGSTRLTWDFNGNGQKEFDMTPTPDGVAESGRRIGDQSGCNEFIIQMNFAVVIEGDKVVPTPTPTPVVTTGGQTQEQTQNQTQNNNNNQTQGNQTQTQTVNVTVPSATPTPVVTTKVPVKTPDTGIGVLGMATMFGTAPLGYALSRYGRGRMIGKKEEAVDELASKVFEARTSRKGQ